MEVLELIKPLQKYNILIVILLLFSYKIMSLRHIFIIGRNSC